MTRDVVCGLEIDEAAAEEAGLASEYEDQVYYFCSNECKAKFDHTPAVFAEPTLEEQREDNEGGRPFAG